MLYVTFWNLFGTLWNMVPMPQQVTRDSTKNFTMAHQSWTICSMYVQCTHHLSKRFVIKTPFFNLENDIIFDVWISNFVFSSRLKTPFFAPNKNQTRATWSEIWSMCKSFDDEITRSPKLIENCCLSKNNI